jgi:hypothetical protein
MAILLAACAKEVAKFRIKSLLTVEVVVVALIWSSGLASRVQLPVASVIVVTRT